LEFESKNYPHARSIIKDSNLYSLQLKKCRLLTVLKSKLVPEAKVSLTILEVKE
jgi:hypothetical protein